MELESRFNSLGEQSPKGEIEGYCVLWSESSDIGKFKETFLKDSLNPDSSGVSLYYQHDKRRLLGNTKAGTLEIIPDKKGLKYKARLPRNAKDIQESIERKDIPVSYTHLTLPTIYSV